MEEWIGGLDIWDQHGHRVSCKVLEILEDAFRAVEICSCVVWQHEEEGKQLPIGRTLLNIEDNRSDIVRDFMGAHVRITTRNMRGCGVSDSGNSGEFVQCLWKKVSFVDKINPGPQKRL